MTLRTSLRRFFSWDSRNGTKPTSNGETIRANDTANAQFNGRSNGSDTTYANRFNH